MIDCSPIVSQVERIRKSNRETETERAEREDARAGENGRAIIYSLFVRSEREG